MVSDYPYGGTRCRIRFWLEHNPKKGFRFCSQTENPKTLRWNAPKRSTYSLLAACMYLDEKGHVQWDTVNEYSNVDKVAEFVNLFPVAATKILKAWCLKKAVYARGRAEGKIQFTINGEVRPDSEEEIRKNQEEADKWLACSRLIP